MKKIILSTVKKLASLKMAVINIVLLSVLVAIGTFVEAKYNSTFSAKYVYKTFWMYIIMSSLAINLTAVMIDRWPWKQRHYPFVLAHIGILILLFGSLITLNFGIDGSMRIPVNERSRYVSIPQMDLSVFSSFDGQNYAKLYEQDVDFYTHSPEKNKISIPTDQGPIDILHFEPFMLGSRRIVRSENLKNGGAIRFQIFNQMTSMNEWLMQRTPESVDSKTFGLASFHFVNQLPKKGSGKNELYIQYKDNGKLPYVLFRREAVGEGQKGFVSEGGSIQTPWMGLEFKLLRFLAKAEESWEYQKSPQPSELTTAAVEVQFQGKNHWLQENDIIKLFTEKAVYILSYSQRRIDLGFDIFLRKFEVDHYQGTMRASAYKSFVDLSGAFSSGSSQVEGSHVISMNEPMKLKGMTFYQASFQQDENGQPIASILSVNYDPGRWLKYLGALIISLGTILLFYNKRKTARQFAPKTGVEV